MSGPPLATTTMRFGNRLGMAVVVLIALGPFIIRNFGIGDSLRFMPLPEAWEAAPVALLASLTYLILLVPCVLLSAALITTSRVIRHAEVSDIAS